MCEWCENRKVCLMCGKPLPKENALPPLRSNVLFDCSVANTQTYRSMVNMTDDMIRVTLDMTRNEWRRIKLHIKQSNAEDETSEGSE